MNFYQCFYNGKSAEIRAETTRAAQLKAAKLWKVKPSAHYRISVMLCAKADGVAIIHTATF